MSIPVAENRKDERYLVRDLAAFHSESKKLLGKVLNLSLSGMFVSLNDPIEVHSIIGIELRHTLNAYSDLTCRAEVKWLRQNDISGLYGIGLEFLGNSDEQRRQLQKVLNTYSVMRTQSGSLQGRGG